MNEQILDLFESDDDQIEGTNEIENLFMADEVETEEVEQADEVEAEDTTEVETETVELQEESQAENTFKLPYKYKDEIGEITNLEDAQKLVQLGMLYERKVLPEFEKLKAISEPFNKLSEVANLYGMDVNALTESLMNQYYEQQADVQGVTPEMIRKEKELADKEIRLQEKENIEQTNSQKQAMYDRFLEVYPEVDSKSINANTWAMVDKGIDLVTAYTKQINEELTQQLKLKEQNLKNKSTSPVGSVTKNGATEPTQKEDFADELLSYFKEEDLNMAVNLAKKFQSKGAQAYTLGSLTKAAFGAEFDFVGAVTAVVYTLTSQSLGNYTRTGANRYGTPTELQDTTQELTITRDRSFSITVDEGNRKQQPVEKTAAKVTGLQMMEQLFPEIDTYNLGVLLAGATTASQVNTAATTASNAYTQLLALSAFLDNNKVPSNGRMVFVTPAIYNFLKLDTSFIKGCDMAQKMLATGVLGEIDGIRIVKVPSSYMPANTSMILTHPTANVAPMQIESIKTADNPPGINGLLVEGRFVYDAFCLSSKQKATAAQKSA